MKKFLLKFFALTFAICAFFVETISPAEAVIAKGYAPIVNGDIDGAKREARKQAMREVVEATVGVRVQSSTEVANMMVIKDEISLRSDGYVAINRVIKEEAQGEVFYVELDVTAQERLIREFEDMASAIEANIPDSNVRGRVMVAVVAKDMDGNYTYSDREDSLADYLNHKLRDKNFVTVRNDDVVKHLLYHSNDPDFRIETRRIARESRTSENSLMRGVLATESVRRVNNVYEATVKASFEVIGLDSDVSDNFSKYAKAVAPTPDDAIEAAKEKVVGEAFESLSAQALATMQREMRGGNTNIQTTIIVDNVTNYQAQYPLIKAGLENAHCKVIRMTRPSATSLAFFVSTDSYSVMGELEQALLSAIPGIQPGINNAQELGSTKIRLMF